MSKTIDALRELREQAVKIGKFPTQEIQSIHKDLIMGTQAVYDIIVKSLEVKATKQIYDSTISATLHYTREGVIDSVYAEHNIDPDTNLWDLLPFRYDICRILGKTSNVKKWSFFLLNDLIILAKENGLSVDHYDPNKSIKFTADKLSSISTEPKNEETKKL